jgi:hypothetical protein
MFKKVQLGYVVISAPKSTDPRNRMDGWIMIKKGNQRGFDAGDAADQTKQDPGDEAKPKDKKKKDKKGKDKKKKDGDDNKKDKGQADPDKEEQQAASKLKLAGMFESDGLIKQAKQKYKDIIKQFPNTEAAKEAKVRLKRLEK